MTFYVHDDDRLWQDSEQRGWFRFPGPFRYILFLVLLVFLIIGIWYLFSFVRGPVKMAELPLIRADETPIKIKAEDQGVPGISHQDKLVYGRIRSDKNVPPPVEHILPDPEPPLSQVKESPPPIKMVDQYTPEDINLEKVVDKKPEAAKVPSIKSIEALIEDEEPVKKEVSTEKGNIFIQLGSLKSYDLAEAEWSRLSKKHKDVLGEHDPLIQKVDLGEDQGIYYRLRTSFDDESKAKAACSILKDRQIDCLVIR